MRIQHNIMAMNAYRNYTNNTSSLAKNLEKLSSGYKINRAGDDAAGLAISEKMRAQITGLDVAQKNAKDGISLVQTAEGALTEVHDMLNRMYALAEQSANGTYSETVDRENLQAEVDQLSAEIDRIANTSNFNGIKLLNGELSNSHSKDAIFGTVNLSFGGSGAQAVKISADKGISAGSIKVTLAGSNGGTKATVKLGSKAAASYTAEQIQEAIRKHADAENKANFKTFSVSGGKIDLAASASTKMASSATLSSNGVGKGGLKLQIGPDGETGNQLILQIGAMSAEKLGVQKAGAAVTTTDTDKTGIKIDKAGDALNSLGKIKNAINEVSKVRGTLGATQNRLDHTIKNLSVMQENIQDAESTIRDTDVGKEMMAYTKNNILVQSAQAMLAQANQVPQGVLQLLQ